MSVSVFGDSEGIDAYEKDAVSATTESTGTAIPWQAEYGPEDWPEDSSHENGDYGCRCSRCGTVFMGHKRRVVCKVCFDKSSAERPAVALTHSNCSGLQNSQGETVSQKRGRNEKAIQSGTSTSR